MMNLRQKCDMYHSNYMFYIVLNENKTAKYDKGVLR